MKYFTFKNGNQIPALGFGTWDLLGQECVNSTLKALETGYRHIDTADKYANHRQVGKAMEQSGVDRKDIFLTSKVFYNDLKPENIKRNVERFLEELETGYLDLLLIHWPNKNIALEESLKAMDQLKKEGIIKNIGVSNFTENHLKDCLKTGVEVVNNQVEIHPSLAQFKLQKFCDENKILVTAYSPFGRGVELENEALGEIAQKHNKSISQVIIAWILSRGIIVIPKATSEEHIKENFEALDFKLPIEDIDAINNLDRGERIINPEWSEFDY